MWEIFGDGGRYTVYNLCSSFLLLAFSALYYRYCISLSEAILQEKIILHRAKKEEKLNNKFDFIWGEKEQSLVLKDV